MMNPRHFYNNYYGHKIDHIYAFYSHIKQKYAISSIIYLVGDSTLDNKYYTKDSLYAPATYGYDTFLNPPFMTKDVCYHLSNRLQKSKNFLVINCAVEESMIKTKYDSLLEHDKFVIDNISSNDILIVSIGGNDLALEPAIMTIVNMYMLMFLNSKECLRCYPEKAWGMCYFVNLFREGIKNYIEQLVSKTKPKIVIICSIYFPDKSVGKSWADTLLDKLCYNNDPELLELIIKYIHKEAISKIKIKDVNIKYFPMYTVLDGTDTKDYVGRVEPSVTGGKKIADGLFDLIARSL